ncbi:MAG: lipid-A-disaccharide synthase [Deltaproteobacteria bacterium]|nr:lipid-A-disaccharide synthase [Deltaproteobacteria bacterium]
MILAGEASGDLYGAYLARAIKSISPDTTFFGLGGQEMEKAGVKIIYESSLLAVVGLMEVIYKSRYILKALRETKKILAKSAPDLLILIDYPGFNLNVAKSAHALGIPVLYYIPPQLWAWWKGRVNKLSKRVDQLAVILPFEKQFYREYGMKVEYVGHPLLDLPLPTESKREITERLGIDNKQKPIIGLLPGSRSEEIIRHMPVMVDAAAIISHYYPDLHCVLPLASTIKKDMLRRYIDNSGLNFTIESIDTKILLKISDVAFIASGTATLEASIMRTPMVIVYKVSPVSYILGKLLIHVRNVGLVNLVADKEIVPELIQGAATAENVAKEGITILENSVVREEIKADLSRVNKKLGKGGASIKTADIAAKMMGLVG